MKYLPTAVFVAFMVFVTFMVSFPPGMQEYVVESFVVHFEILKHFQILFLYENTFVNNVLAN